MKDTSEAEYEYWRLKKVANSSFFSRHFALSNKLAWSISKKEAINIAHLHKLFELLNYVPQTSNYWFP